jgi:hypothetical protein
MNVSSIFSSAYSALSPRTPSSRAPDPTQASSPASSEGSSAGVSSYDFSNITPKALQSTINDLVKSGKLSLIDSSPLVTIAGFNGASANGGNQSIDVLSALKAGISYKQQNEADVANSGIENWTNALAALEKLQGTASGVNISA